MTTDRPRLEPSRTSPGDLVRVAGDGLRARPMRVVLSALGIALGIAAMVSVLGISSSSRATLDAQIEALGTNLLTVGPDDDVFGDEGHLPDSATPMIGAVDGVESVSAVAVLPKVKVYRTDQVPEAESGGIAVMAADLDLLETVGTHPVAGSYLNRATRDLPVVVLGHTAAARLGVAGVGPDRQVFLGEQWFTVTGILAPTPLAPELDTAALVGWPAADGLGTFEGHPTTIYTRTDPDRVTEVRSVLAATANPAAPDQVSVSRPSDALAAKQAADATLDSLVLGLGVVAVVVGGVGVANTMVLSVLERREEIGLRRSLGATRAHVRHQFLAEAVILSVLGGLVGVLGGVLLTAVYATAHGWPTVVPWWVSAAGLAVTAVLGGAAGLYPAVRASRMSPTEALAGR